MSSPAAIPNVQDTEEDFLVFTPDELSLAMSAQKQNEASAAGECRLWANIEKRRAEKQAEIQKNIDRNARADMFKSEYLDEDQGLFDRIFGPVDPVSLLSPTIGSDSGAVTSGSEDEDDELDCLKRLTSTGSSSEATTSENEHEPADMDSRASLLDAVTPAPLSTPATSTSENDAGALSDEKSNDTSLVQQASHISDPFVSRRATTTFKARTPASYTRGRVVVLYNLPAQIDMRDVLARVTTGEITNAHFIKCPNSLSSTPGTETGAVIYFKERKGAEEFARIARNDAAMWQFQPDSADTEGTPPPPPPRVEVSYVPDIIDSSTIVHSFAEIPLEPPQRFAAADEDATRCLVIDNVAFNMIEDVWDALGLEKHLSSAYSPYYVRCIEDIWMDGFRSDSDGRIVAGRLHIWFYCTKMAVDAKKNTHDRPWAQRVTYEKDPCNNQRPSSSIHTPENPSIAWGWHSIPSHSLLSVWKAGTMSITALFQQWTAITDAQDETQTSPPPPVRRRRPKTFAEHKREQDARSDAIRANGGIDPITLQYRNGLDYDLDAAGNVCAPIIDARTFEAAMAASRRAKVLKTLLAREAYVSALATAAASPGTPVEATAMDDAARAAMLTRVRTRYDTPPPQPVVFRSPVRTVMVPWEGAFSGCWDYTCDPEPMRRALKNSGRTIEISLDELRACDDFQRKTRNTSFYVPPAGFNTRIMYRCE